MPQQPFSLVPLRVVDGVLQYFYQGWHNLVDDNTQGTVPSDLDIEGNATVGIDLEVAGDLQVEGFVANSASVELEAVGSDRASALELLAQINIVSTAATSAVGVLLPSSADLGVGGFVDVYNDGPSNSFHIYGSGDDEIDGTAGATGVALTNEYWARFFVSAPNVLKSYRYPITRAS